MCTCILQIRPQMSKTSLVVHNLLVASYQLDNEFSLKGSSLSCSKSVLSLKIFKVKLLNSSAFKKVILFWFFTLCMGGEKVLFSLSGLQNWNVLMPFCFISLAFDTPENIFKKREEKVLKHSGKQSKCRTWYMNLHHNIRL